MRERKLFLKEALVLIMNVILVLTTLTSVIAIATVPASAAKGSDFSDNSIIAERIDKALEMFPSGSYFTKNGKPCSSCHGSNVDCVANGSDCNCLRYVNVDGKKVDLLASQCMGYTRFWQYMLFGVMDNNESKFSTLSGVSTWTADGVKNWFVDNKSVLHPGTRLRVRYRNWDASHFIVLLDVDYENGKLTYIECNKDNQCGVSSITTKTWSSFVSTFSKMQNAWVYKNYHTEFGTVFSDVPDGTYYLRNFGFYSYVIEDKTGRGTIGASSTVKDERCKFNIVKEGDYYRISPVSTSNGYVLNCYWGSGGTHTQSGNEITLWKNDGDKSQRWVFEEKNGFYYIHPADALGLSLTREGEKLYVKETANSTSQIWMLETKLPCSHRYECVYDSSNHWQQCRDCADKTDLGAHTYGSWVTVEPSDCNKLGTKKATCTGCDFSITDVIPKTNHSYTLQIYGGYKHYTCSICGNTYKEAIPTVTSGTTPPVTNTPVTNTPVTNTPVTNTPVTNTPVTNTPVTNTPVTNTPVTTPPVTNTPVTNTPVTNTPVTNTPVTNTPVTNTPVTNTPVTNTPVTNTPVTNTPVTNTPVTNTPVTSAPEDAPTEPSEHRYGEWDITIRATCTEKGEKQRVCDDCGDIDVKTMPAIGHSFGEWFKSGEVDGIIIERRDCTACGEYETREDGGLNKGTVWDKIVSALGGSTNAVIVIVAGISAVTVISFAVIIRKRR